MTCIVGFENKGSVYIGGDSAGVDGGFGRAVRVDEKVFINGRMIFGFTSSFRMGQILRYSFTPPAQAVGEGDFEYLCGRWIDSLIDCLKKKGYATIENNSTSGGEFLLGFNGKLYHVQSDFQVGKRVEPFDACGCAEDYAIGVMSALNDSDKMFVTDLSPEVKITKALETAARFSAGVMGPFVIKKLDSEQVDIVPALVEILSKENND